MRMWVHKVLDRMSVKSLQFFKDFNMGKWVNRTLNVSSELPFCLLNHCPLLNVPVFILSHHSESAMNMNEYLMSSETFHDLTLLEISTWTLKDSDSAIPQTKPVLIQIIFDMFHLRGWSLKAWSLLLWTNLVLVSFCDFFLVLFQQCLLKESLGPTSYWLLSLTNTSTVKVSFKTVRLGLFDSLKEIFKDRQHAFLCKCLINICGVFISTAHWVD